MSYTEPKDGKITIYCDNLEPETTCENFININADFESYMNESFLEIAIQSGWVCEDGEFHFCSKCVKEQQDDTA